MDPQQLRVAIRLAQSGGEEGYRAILDAYGSRLYGFFYRATASRHEAEDLLGEMALRLVQRLGSYDDQGRFESWLFRIAANLIRDRLRRRKTNPPPGSLSFGDDGDTPLADRLPGRFEPVDAPLLLQEASWSVQEAMGHLDAQTRDMILMRHFGGMSFREIAEVFGCPLGTALAKVHRGMRALRERLERSYGAE